MRLEDITAMLKGTGLPVAYRAWPERKAPPLPYICYLVSYSNNFSADGVVYAPFDHILIELYTKIKSPETEDKVENALASFFWEKEETYIDTERCYQITYEIEV